MGYLVKYRCNSCNYKVNTSPPGEIDRGFVSICKSKVCSKCKEVRHVLIDLERSSGRYKPEMDSKAEFDVCGKCGDKNLKEWDGKCPKCGGMMKAEGTILWD